MKRVITTYNCAGQLLLKYAEARHTVCIAPTTGNNGAHGQNPAVPRLALIAAIVVATTLPSLSLTAQQNTNQPIQPQPQMQQPDYAAFRIITERNIFAARRSGRVTRSAAPRQQRQIESFTLVGTLETPNGTVAFFDGTSSEYRKATKLGDKIAGFTVAEINFKGALLKNEHQNIQLPVGSKLRLQDNGQWEPVSTSEFFPQSSSVPSGNITSQTTDPGEPGADGPINDVLKRLMQQRERELQ